MAPQLTSESVLQPKTIQVRLLDTKATLKFSTSDRPGREDLTVASSDRHGLATLKTRFCKHLNWFDTYIQYRMYIIYIYIYKYSSYELFTVPKRKLQGPPWNLAGSFFPHVRLVRSQSPLPGAEWRWLELNWNWWGDQGHSGKKRMKESLRNNKVTLYSCWPWIFLIQR